MIGMSWTILKKGSSQLPLSEVVSIHSGTETGPVTWNFNDIMSI
jgi:hypothetical protein